MGGYSFITAEVKVVTAEQLIIEYNVFDHFGGGKGDDTSRLPGLPELYYLQHYKSDGKKYIPFIWNVEIVRKIKLNE